MKRVLIILFSYGLFTSVYSQSLDSTYLKKIILGKVLSQISYERIRDIKWEEDTSRRAILYDYESHLKFINYDCSIAQMTLSELNDYDLFSRNGIKLIAFDNALDIGCGIDLKAGVFNLDFSYRNETMTSGIVGVSETQGWYFISGYYLKDNIKPLIGSILENETDMQSYIRVKYYNFSPETITIKRKKLVSFYSQVLKRNMLIRIPKNLDKQDKINPPLPREQCH